MRRFAARKSKQAETAPITGDGLVVAHSESVKCDICGEPKGTLYRHDGKLVCFRELPFNLRSNTTGRLLRYAVSGVKAIKAARAALNH